MACVDCSKGRFPHLHGSTWVYSPPVRATTPESPRILDRDQRRGHHPSGRDGDDHLQYWRDKQGGH